MVSRFHQNKILRFRLFVTGYFIPIILKVMREQKKCWFCLVKDNTINMHFDSAFDTYFHMTCLRLELQNDPDNWEAEVMSKCVNLDTVSTSKVL